MLAKIKKLFKKDINQGNKILINCEKIENRVVLLEDGNLEEYTLERVDHESVVGSIFKGTVKNVETALKALFIDIGYEKNAFLHFWDAVPGAIDTEMEIIHRKRGKRSNQRKNRRITSKDIPKIYPEGSEVLVQVTKVGIGNKGPRVTTRLSLPGRFLVLMPQFEQFGISRKIEDPKERARLRKTLEKMDIPEGIGLIMRTACQGQKIRYFIRDLQLLLDQWQEIEDKKNSNKSPVCVFREPNIIERTVRDFLTAEIDEVLCDDEDTVKLMKDLTGQISSRSQKRIVYYPHQEPIFVRFGIQRQLDNAFHRQVWLKCGGYIVIDETEALIAIDVNTGRNKGTKSNLDKLILQTNLEAAHEVARQLRLRNMGGLIVIDFIDMKNRRDQNQVYRAMVERLDKDKARTQVLRISQLGLMEMTRQRLHESLADSLYETCTACDGKGVLKSTTTMSAEIQQKIRAVMTRYKSRHKELIVTVHPEVMQRLKEDDEVLVEIERKLEGLLSFRSDPTFRRERVLITDAQTNEIIKI